MNGYLVGIWQILADSYTTIPLLPEMSGRVLQDNLFSVRFLQDNFFVIFLQENNLSARLLKYNQFCAWVIKDN